MVFSSAETAVATDLARTGFAGTIPPGDVHLEMDWLSCLAGAALILLWAADVFLTVLYARSGTGLLSPRLNRFVWWLFRTLAPRKGARRWRWLSFAGPVLLLANFLMWVALLVVGFALLIWPDVGRSIVAVEGEGDTGFATALYYAGLSLATLGTGDVVATTGGWRVLMMLKAFLGFFFLSLITTYLISIYSAIVRRNSVAQEFHHASAGSGSSIEAVIQLAGGGQFSEARMQIASMARGLLDLLESHHSYPVLHYFQMPRARYSTARTALLALDTASLLRSCLAEKHRALSQSAAVAMLWGAALDLLDTLVQHEGLSSVKEASSVGRQRYRAALLRLRESGIATTADGQGGETQYLDLRNEWVERLRALGAFEGYSWEELERS